jgi:hypothetical protein
MIAKIYLELFILKSSNSVNLEIQLKDYPPTHSIGYAYGKKSHGVGDPIVIILN